MHHLLVYAQVQQPGTGDLRFIQARSAPRPTPAMPMANSAALGVLRKMSGRNLRQIQIGIPAPLFSLAKREMSYMALL